LPQRNGEAGDRDGDTHRPCIDLPHGDTVPSNASRNRLGGSLEIRRTGWRAGSLGRETARMVRWEYLSSHRTRPGIGARV
jgi:hypothetical protein